MFQPPGPGAPSVQCVQRMGPHGGTKTSTLDGPEGTGFALYLVRDSKHGADNSASEYSRTSKGTKAPTGRAGHQHHRPPFPCCLTFCVLMSPETPIPSPNPKAPSSLYAPKLTPHPRVSSAHHVPKPSHDPTLFTWSRTSAPYQPCSRASCRPVIAVRGWEPGSGVKGEDEGLEVEGSGFGPAGTPRERLTMHWGWISSRLGARACWGCGKARVVT